MIECLETMLARDRQAREAKDRANHELFVRLQAALQLAEIKHPVFAVSFEQGLCRAMEELGETAQASNKGQGANREEAEVLDLLCVVWRLARGDWKEAGHV